MPASHMHPHIRAWAVLLIFCGSASIAYPQGLPDSRVLLGDGLEKMQALVVTAHMYQTICSETLPKLEQQMRSDLKTHIQFEQALYAKLNDTWRQLETERRVDVQMYYWVIERRVKQKLEGLARAPSGKQELETECGKFFFDLKTGSVRRAAPDMFAALDEFVAGKNPWPPTFPFLDDLARTRARGK